ncbi:MAG: hypothetical protein EHM62_01525 [Methylococcus sp.]|nr:MAG: hypothetical protein EHM62_01525 [Methylococcus sp.]
MNTRITLALTLILLGFFGLAQATTRIDDRDWNFTVYLDDDPVGRHRFTLDESEEMRQLRSEARFTVKLLMIKAYSYQHEAQETWRGDCLNALKANTDDNGEKIAVVGSEKNGRFEIKKGTQAETLPACIMTFAYWNPLILKQSKLLNPQNGEYLNVRVQPQGREAVQVKGKSVTADKYHLDAGKFQIDLWYADGGRWVALDSLLDNGRKLRYRIE